MLKALERAGRVAVAWVLGWLARRPPMDHPSLRAAPRVLVVRLDRRVGNLLLTTPLLAALAARWPRAELHAMVHGDLVPVLAAHPALAHIWSFHKWGPTRWWRLVRRVRAQRFDLVLNAGDPSSVNHALFTALSGARVRVGTAEPPLSRMYDRVAPAPAADAHEIDRRLALLAALHGGNPAGALDYYPPHPVEAVRDTAGRDLLAPGASPRVVLIPGARLAERRAPAQLLEELARTLQARGLEVVLAPGPGERALADAVHAAVPGSALVLDTGLPELAALMRACGRVVGNDTGTSHLASAVGARSLVLFHTTDPARYGPRGPGSAAVDLRGLEPDEAVARAHAALLAWCR